MEIGKFALPAVIAWFARQPTINELRLNLEAMTAAKARADEEASKIRAKLVELRNKLALAEKAVADQKTAAETLMNRRNSVKEVKMKQMSVDHNGQMKKVREDAAKEIQVAKSLEVGARWREEACRRMKNRAEADAEGLREKLTSSKPNSSALRPPARRIIPSPRCNTPWATPCSESPRSRGAPQARSTKGEGRRDIVQVGDAETEKDDSQAQTRESSRGRVWKGDNARSKRLQAQEEERRRRAAKQ